MVLLSQCSTCFETLLLPNLLQTVKHQLSLWNSFQIRIQKNLCQPQLFNGTGFRIAIWGFLFFFNFFNVYSFLRDREWMGEGQRERETQNMKQAPGSEMSAQSPTWGSNSQTEIMTWAEVGCLTSWATQAPLYCFLKWNFVRSHFRNCAVFRINYIIQCWY